MLTIPYHKNLINPPSIFDQFGIQVVFKNNNNIKSLLIENSPRRKEGCIYSIPCKNCDFIYIGQTGKGLNKIISQHKDSIRTGKVSSGLFVHQRDYGHNIDWGNSKVVTSCNDIVERNIIDFF